MDTTTKITIEHHDLIKWVTDAEDATIDSRKSSEKCRDYYDSKQLQDEEKRVMRARGQAPVVINRVKPKMDGLFGMEKANRTTCKAYPRTPQHTNDADSCTEAIRYVLQDNFYPVSRSAAWQNMCIEGTGGVEVIAVDAGDETKIKINYIQWDRLIYDPHSRRKNFSDARYLGQVVWMDYDAAVALYPEKKDILESMIGGTGTTYDDKPRWINGKRRRVKIVELYYRDGKDIHYAVFTRGGYLKDPKISPYVDEEGQAEWPYEFASSFVTRDGDRYGAMLQLLDVQDEVNKRRSKALHLMSVRQVRAEKGAVEDINKTRAELARPDGLIETTPGMEFEVLKTGDMAAAQFNLLTEAKQEIDSVGVNAAMSGKQEGAASGIALNTRIQSGQTEVASMFDTLKYLDICVYRKVWNRIRQYWKDEKWIRVTDDEENVKFVGLNRKITKGELVMEKAKKQNIPPEQMQMLEQHIAQDPSMGELTTQNNVSELDVDLVIADAPDSPTMDVEQFQGLAEVIKSGAPPVLIEALIQASSIPRKEQLLKRLKGEGDVPPAVKQKIEQMQEQGQKLQEELQKVTQENQKLKTQDAEGMAKLQVEQQLEAARFQQEQQRAEQEFQLKAFTQQKEMELARQKAEAEITLKREIAAADLEIEAAKMQCENEHAQKQMEFDQKVKFAESPEMAEAQVIPKVAEALMMFAQAFEKMNETMQNGAQIQQQTLKVQEQTLKAITAPKQVSLSGVKRDSAGHITAATVNPTIQ